MPGEPLPVVPTLDKLSSDSEMRFFSGGVGAEFVRRSSRGTQLKVIGRASSFQFRGQRRRGLDEIFPMQNQNSTKIASVLG